MLDTKKYVVVPKDQLIHRTNYFRNGVHWSDYIEIKYWQDHEKDDADLDLQEILKDNDKLREELVASEKKIRDLEWEMKEKMKKERESYLEKLKIYNQRIEELENYTKVTDVYKDELKQAVNRIEKLKNRSLWQRILNKD